MGMQQLDVFLVASTEICYMAYVNKKNEVDVRYVVNFTDNQSLQRMAHITKIMFK